MVIVFVFTLGNSTDALLMVKANEVGVKVAFIPLVYMITSIVAVLLAIPVGSLSDRVGKEKILIAGYLIYAIVYYRIWRHLTCRGNSRSFCHVWILFSCN